MSSRQRKPVVWLITDQKPGHKNQLRGVGNRLKALTGAICHEVDATSYHVPLWKAVLGIAPQLHQLSDSPDLLIAGGHGTHRLLLALRRMKGAKTVCLMRPSFPISWVDAVIAPEHDDLPDRPKVLPTHGAMNTMTPLARLTEKESALFLIGGPSKHIQWDDDLVISQIRQLMSLYPSWHWTISNSRRTPESLTRKLEALAGAKVEVFDYKQTHSSWLAHRLSASRAVWVTPESVSMVFEAVTSGVPTGLLDLSLSGKSRVAESVDRLIREGYVAHWTDHAGVMRTNASRQKTLWEADRAAQWLAERFLDMPAQ